MPKRARLGVEPEVPSSTLTLDPPVRMEVGDYIVFSIPELQSLHIASVKIFGMDVGFWNLSLACRPYGIEIATDQEDEHARKAFVELKQKLQAREVPMLGRALKYGYAGLALPAFLLSIANIYFRQSAITVIFVTTFSLAMILLAWEMLFWRRRRTVVFDYRENVQVPWYRSNGFYIAVAAAIIAGILGIITDLLGWRD